MIDFVAGKSEKCFATLVSPAASARFAISWYIWVLSTNSADMAFTRFSGSLFKRP